MLKQKITKELENNAETWYNFSTNKPVLVRQQELEFYTLPFAGFRERKGVLLCELHHKPSAPSDVVCHREGARLNAGYFIFLYFPPAS